jgi:uncharacterized Fe-S cluster protein YjdI
MKKYANKDITVTWEPEKCIHSRQCFGNLMKVFDPRKRPWINLEGADTESIKKAIDGCPSGALGYYSNEADVGSNTNSTEQINEDAIRIKLLSNGPIEFNGECVIIDKDGNESYKTGKFFLCRCGSSNNKPFCDGSHRKVDFKD